MKILKVLACGDAFGIGGRHTTSFLVKDEDCSFLIDGGSSSLVRLKQMGTSISQIEAIFISHFHGDHFGSIPFMVISCLYELQVKIPFTIYVQKELNKK